MSKPLELTVYPMWDNGFGEMYADKDDPMRPVSADFEVYRKRLTDTELAAEVFSAVFHEAECEVRGLRLILRDQEHPDIDVYAKHNREFGRQADILRRFAALPHYDEDAQ